MMTTNNDRPMQHYAKQNCHHEWGTDGVHSNVFCKKCFVDKPEGIINATNNSPPQTPEHQALMRAVDIYLKCQTEPDTPCLDDCKLLRRRIGEWAICAHLQQAGEMMLKREKEAQEAGHYNYRTGGYVKGL